VTVFIAAPLVLVACQCLLARPVLAASARVVAPGSLVRWQARGTTACHLLGRSWAAVDDTCLFPLDLLLPEGQLELARTVDHVVETTTVAIGPYPYPVQRLTVASDKVDLSPEDLARSRNEAQLIVKLWQRETTQRFRLPLGPPLDHLPGGGGFGNRRILNGEPRSPHSGVDYAAPAGTPVHAAAAGQVVLVADLFFSGNSIFIDHGGGLITMYFHLEAVSVGLDSLVERGERIGSVGATGRATGPHLHFGVRWHGARVNPAPLLEPAELLPDLDVAAP